MHAARVFLRPKWIVGHLLVVTVVVVCANLSLWQWQRHEWRQERNEEIRAGLALPAAPLSELDEQHRAYRATTVSGEWLREADVLLTPRNERGPGHHVLTPLRLDDGALLVVDRGWVPFRFDVPPVPGTQPAAGRVQLKGVLLPATEVDARATRDDAGRLLRVAAVDPQVVAGPDAVADIFLLEQSDRELLPVPGPLPEPDAGPHLSYAVQWLVFALVGVGGYPLLLRRVYRDATAPQI